MNLMILSSLKSIEYPFNSQSDSKAIISIMSLTVCFIVKRTFVGRKKCYEFIKSLLDLQNENSFE